MSKNTCSGRVVICIMCTKMVLVSNRSLTDFSKGVDLPLTPDSTFRITYCHSCTNFVREKKTQNGRTDLYAGSGLVLSPSMISTWRPYLVVKGVLGHNGFLLAKYDEDTKTTVIEPLYKLMPIKDEKVVNIRITSEITISRYEPGGFFGEIHTKDIERYHRHMDSETDVTVIMNL